MFKRKKKITLKVELVYGLFSNKSNPNQTATLMFAHSSQGKTLVWASFVHQMLPRKVVKEKKYRQTLLKESFQFSCSKNEVRMRQLAQQW